MFRKKTVKKDYDHDNLIQVLHCSICNGEQVAGFKNIHTGEFQDIMFISSPDDLNTFMKTYGIEDIRREY